MKDALTSQLEEFLKSSDLGESLGISSEEQQKIGQSIIDYVDQYELNEEELTKIQDSVKGLLQNTEGMDFQSIESMVNSILEQ